MPNSLIIFDVDGTLTQTVKLDSESYFEAFSSYLPYEGVDKNWLNYKYSTDSGLAIELFEKYTSHTPLSEDIISTIKSKFFLLLKEKLKQDATRCIPVPGANKIFEEILNLNRWDISIATGCWKQSALIKLEHINFPYLNIPIASGDDDVDRHEIIRVAIERSQKHYDKSSYDQVIYVGDRQWDYRAAQNLGIGFIGIGHTLRNNKFNIPVIDDYMNGSLISLLNHHTGTNAIATA